jgi:hypothetical protein
MNKIQSPMKRNSELIVNFCKNFEKIANFEKTEIANNANTKTENLNNNDFLLLFNTFFSKNLNKDKENYKNLSFAFAYNGFSYNKLHQLNPYNNEDINITITIKKDDEYLKNTLIFDNFTSLLKTFNKSIVLENPQTINEFLFKLKEHFDLKIEKEKIEHIVPIEIAKEYLDKKLVNE